MLNCDPRINFPPVSWQILWNDSASEQNHELASVGLIALIEGFGHLLHNDKFLTQGEKGILGWIFHWHKLTWLQRSSADSYHISFVSSIYPEMSVGPVEISGGRCDVHVLLYTCENVGSPSQHLWRAWDLGRPERLQQWRLMNYRSLHRVSKEAERPKIWCKQVGSRGKRRSNGDGHQNRTRAGS